MQVKTKFSVSLQATLVTGLYW